MSRSERRCRFAGRCILACASTHPSLFRNDGLGSSAVHTCARGLAIRVAAELPFGAARCCRHFAAGVGCLVRGGRRHRPCLWRGVPTRAHHQVAAAAAAAAAAAVHCVVGALPQTAAAAASGPGARRTLAAGQTIAPSARCDASGRPRVAAASCAAAAAAAASDLAASTRSRRLAEPSSTVATPSLGQQHRMQPGWQRTSYLTNVVSVSGAVLERIVVQPRPVGPYPAAAACLAGWSTRLKLSAALARQTSAFQRRLRTPVTALARRRCCRRSRRQRQRLLACRGLAAARLRWCL